MYEFSVGFPWDFYKLFTGILVDSYRASMKDYYGISSKCLLDSYGDSMIYLWDSYRMNTEVLGISVGILWNFFVVLILFPWTLYGISMGFP